MIFADNDTPLLAAGYLFFVSALILNPSIYPFQIFLSAHRRLIGGILQGHLQIYVY